MLIVRSVKSVKMETSLLISCKTLETSPKSAFCILAESCYVCMINKVLLHLLFLFVILFFVEIGWKPFVRVVAALTASSNKIMIF